MKVPRLKLEQVPAVEVERDAETRPHPVHSPAPGILEVEMAPSEPQPDLALCYRQALGTLAAVPKWKIEEPSIPDLSVVVRVGGMAGFLVRRSWLESSSFDDLIIRRLIAVLRATLPLFHAPALRPFFAPIRRSRRSAVLYSYQVHGSALPIYRDSVDDQTLQLFSVRQFPFSNRSVFDPDLFGMMSNLSSSYRLGLIRISFPLQPCGLRACDLLASDCIQASPPARLGCRSRILRRNPRCE